MQPENNTTTTGKKKLTLENLPETIKLIVAAIAILIAAYSGSDLGQEKPKDYGPDLERIEKKQDDNAKKVEELAVAMQAIKDAGDGTLSRVIKLEVEAEHRDRRLTALESK